MKPPMMFGRSRRRFGVKERDERSARVDALFVPWAQKGLPGAAVLVAQGGEALHLKGYGLADLAQHTRIGPDTTFLLASLTKAFTAMAIMILAERGKLDYESPLYEFFPQFHGLARTITVRQLLYHTSGLPDYVDALIDDGLIDPEDCWPRSVATSPSKDEPTAKQTLDALAREKWLSFQPGDRFDYSNAGYIVLGQIVEVVSHSSYAAFLKKEIFDKLGMEHSLVYDETKPKVPHRATSYSWNGKAYQDVDYTPLNFIYGEDGIHTTIQDMLAWHKALLFTGVPVKPWSLRQALVSGTLNSGANTGYGFGWAVAANFVDHSGDWLGFRTYIRHCLADNFTIVVLANCAELNASCMGSDIANIYMHPVQACSPARR